MRYLLITWLLFFPALSQAATITAKADRDTVRLNESFSLVFEADGSVDDDPDFSALEQDFDILNRSQSSNLSIVNGRYSNTTKWALVLMPKSEGVITIPSIPFGKDQSPQMRITIKAAASSGGGNGGMELELSASDLHPRVQGQVIVTVKLISDKNIARYGIDPLKHSGVDAVVEQLGDDKQYRAYRGGRAHLVLERRYALFPQQAGKLHIAPVLGELEIGDGRNGFFDPFGRRNRIKRLRSQALDIEVKAIPSKFSGGHWLPAAEIQLVEEWPDSKDGKPVFKVGEPVTRTLSLLADGLTSAQLPELTPAAIDGIKQYPDQPSLHDNKKTDGIIGIREERIAMIPTRAGRYTLPAIEIPWWNTKTKRMETARIPARKIQVAATAASASPPVTAPTEPASQQAMPTPEPSVPAAATGTLADSGARPWQWLSLALAVAWLLTGLGWWLSRRRQAGTLEKPSAPDSVNLGRAMKDVLRACKTGDARQCQQALIAWGQAYFTDPGLNNLGELGRRAGDPLQPALAELERHLYGDRQTEWNGAAIADACQSFSERPAPGRQAPQEGLEPLFRDRQ